MAESNGIVNKAFEISEDDKDFSVDNHDKSKKDSNDCDGSNEMVPDIIKNEIIKEITNTQHDQASQTLLPTDQIHLEDKCRISNENKESIENIEKKVSFKDENISSTEKNLVEVTKDSESCVNFVDVPLNTNDDDNEHKTESKPLIITVTDINARQENSIEKFENIISVDCPQHDKILCEGIEKYEEKCLKEIKVDNPDTEDFEYRFVGSTFMSFREVPLKTLWTKASLHSEENQLEPVSPTLSRSQYSLVSCGEVTTEALKLWLELPEEVKQDHFWEPFKQQYEKQRGHQTPKHRTQRLPLVQSAPQINNGEVIVEEISVPPNTVFTVPNSKQNGGMDMEPPQKSSKFARARHLTKMTILLAAWVFFTAIFMLYGETEGKHRNSFVDSREVKTFDINTTTPYTSVLVSLTGPFLTEQSEKRLNSSQRESLSYVEVWIEKTRVQNGVIVDMQMSEPWKVYLRHSNLDFNIGELRSLPLHLSRNSSVLNRSTEYNINKTSTDNNISDAKIVQSIRIRTSEEESIPFTLNYKLDPLDPTTGVICAVLLLTGLYALICFEIINRTLAAVLISTLSLAILSLAGSRPTVAALISWLDGETLLLLFSMMVLVAIMAETGMFDYLAVYTFQITKGKMWPLITLLCAITALVSTVLDNVTTVLLMAPVTIRLCEVMGLDPVPILLSMVLYSNIGGTATPVGDPPNVIIASNKLVVMSGINFTEFTLHMTLGILLVAVQTYFQLRFMFRDTSKLRLSVPRDIQELRHQISIWRRATESLPHMSSDQNVVRERLERKIGKLNTQLENMLKESGKRACPKETFHTTLTELKEKYKIRDKSLLIKALIAVAFVVSIFFLHAIPEFNRVSLGWTALLGAILLLILYDRDDLEPILHRVEWSTLLFFAALFVLMEALSQLGLIAYIGGATEALILRVDENARLAVSVTVILWVSGITSAFVDNIPLTTMMVRVVTSLGTNPTLKLPMAPLIWALSFGACLGGNGTVIGASANVVCAGVAEQHGYKFTFMQFLRVGFPVMIGHLIVANAYLLLCHCAFTWH